MKQDIGKGLLCHMRTEYLCCLQIAYGPFSCIVHYMIYLLGRIDSIIRDPISKGNLECKAVQMLTLVLLNKLRCHTISNFQPIRLIKFTYFMANSADPDQMVLLFTANSY